MGDAEKPYASVKKDFFNNDKIVTNSLMNDNHLLLSDLLKASNSSGKTNNNTTLKDLKNDGLGDLPGSLDDLIDEFNGSKKKSRRASNTNDKPKKKRKLFSCETCRKMKTKCNYAPNDSTCERCLRLSLSCQLPTNLINNNMVINNSIEDNKHINDAPPSQLISEQYNEVAVSFGDKEHIESRSNSSEEVIFRLENKLDKLLEIVQRPVASIQNSKTSTASTPQVSNFNELAAMLPRRKDSFAPFNIISSVKTKLLGQRRESSQSQFINACNKFLSIYPPNEIEFLQLAKEFLEVAHFWIIPGGISVIDRDYVTEHPFISCVFIVLAMFSNKNYRGSKLQDEVYEHLNSMVSCIERKNPLTDHDIEALLYVCMYGLCDFDTWMLSSLGLMHFVKSIDLRRIIESVVDENIYEADDLFHLRIFNALCACNIQHAVCAGKPVMIPDPWWKVHRISVIFPDATIGDAIKVAELELYKMLSVNLNDTDYFRKFNCYREEDDLLYFSDLVEWKYKWEKMITKDISRALLLSYQFSNILLSRKIIDNDQEQENTRENKVACNTACRYSLNLLTTFIESKFESIKGAPKFQLNQIVYACITLFEYLPFMKIEDKKISLNLILKSYWHLNKTGQELNDATGTIATIIKKLVELAQNNQVLHIAAGPSKGFIGSGSVTKTSMYSNRKNSQQQRKLSLEDLPIFDDKGNGSSNSSPEIKINHTSGKKKSRNNNFGGINNLYDNSVPPVLDNTVAAVPVLNNTLTEYQIPDLSSFGNFDEFFNDLFTDL